MPISIACPKCRELLDVPDDFLGREVRCASCQQIFTATANAAPGDGVPVARPARKPSRSPEYGDDDRPIRSRKKSGNRLVLWLLLGGAGLSMCACCGGMAVFVGKMMSPDFVPYTSPDGRFSTVFPSDTFQSKRNTGRAAESAQSIESTRTLFQETYFVYFVDLTDADRKKPAEKVAEEFANGLIAMSQNGREHNARNKIAFQGHDAIDLSIALTDGKFTIARVIVTKDRAYVVGVTGPGNPGGASWVEDYMEKFQILEPEAKK